MGTPQAYAGTVSCLLRTKPLRQTYLQVPQTIDQEDIPLPIPSITLPHIRHPLTHLHGRINRFLEQLREILVIRSITLVNQGCIVHHDDLP